MAPLARFECPSSVLQLNPLLKRARHVFWAGLGVALAVHLSLTQLRSSGEQRKAVKPLTTHFVKRQPRLTKPLELKKRPRPRRRQLRREVVRVRAAAAAPLYTEALRAPALLQSLASPRAAVTRAASLQAGDSEPMAAAQAIVTQKEAKDLVDTSLEMMDIEALDTGRYQAVVVQEAGDKRSLRGFLHLGEAYCKSLMALRSEMRRPVLGAAALRALVQAMNKYTQIRTDIAGPCFTFDSKKLLDTPFVLSVANKFAFEHTASEARNLGRYLLGGGFLAADVRGPDWTIRRPGAINMRSLIVDALASRACVYERDWVFEKLPNAHALYFAYFEFPDGPPGGADVINAARRREDALPYVEGVTFHGRLLLVLSLKALSAAWGQDSASMYKPSIDNKRTLQFGVNLIVFALTQEGSITSQVMHSVQ